MKTVTANKPSIQFLQEAHTQVTENVSIHYTLYEINVTDHTYFAVEIFTDEDSSLKILGHCLEKARQCFKTLIRFSVTPCALSDILHDIDHTEIG